MTNPEPTEPCAYCGADAAVHCVCCDAPTCPQCHDNCECVGCMLERHLAIAAHELKETLALVTWSIEVGWQPAAEPRTAAKLEQLLILAQAAGAPTVYKTPAPHQEPIELHSFAKDEPCDMCGCEALRCADCGALR